MEGVSLTVTGSHCALTTGGLPVLHFLPPLFFFSFLSPCLVKLSPSPIQTEGGRSSFMYCSAQEQVEQQCGMTVEPQRGGCGDTQIRGSHKGAEV